jgi:hypothetical protein
MIKSTNQFKAVYFKEGTVTDGIKTKQTLRRAIHKVKVDFGWKIWLLSFLNEKALP